jgi:hypothetical protein
MKATLSFTLPKETPEHWLAVHAGAIAAEYVALLDRMRDLIKYDGGHLTGLTAVEAIDELRAWAYGSLEEAGLPEDKLRG